MTDTPPIVVNANPAVDQMVVAVRQLIIVLSPIATYYGAEHLSTVLGQLSAVLGPAATVITLIMGQLHSRHQSQKLVKMAGALPNSIAKVKGT